jgi:hypothetical protein
MNEEHAKHATREMLNKYPPVRDLLLYKARETLERLAPDIGIAPEDVPEEVVEEFLVALLVRCQGDSVARIEELVPQEEIEQWIEEEPTLEAAAQRMEKEYPQLLRKGPRKRH